MSLGELAPGPYDYRPLKRGQEGWDIAALQSALIAGGHPLERTERGTFNLATARAVKLWQGAHGLVVDGIAGIITQRSLALALGEPMRRAKGLPVRLLMGQIEKESGYLLGNYTEAYAANGSRDIGVVQRNTRYATMAEGFDVPASLAHICANTRAKFDAYKGKPGAPSIERAWKLAAGSWNAPAWTDRLAAGGVLTVAQSEHIEGYIDRVCSYVTVWPAK